MRAVFSSLVRLVRTGRAYGSAVALTALAIAGCSRPATDDSNVYTLYRTTPVENPTPDLLRVHVATFDAAAEEEYNRENCDIARGLFQAQPGVVVRYFCEKGRYRP
jgi:hypothetical protein